MLPIVAAAGLLERVDEHSAHQDDAISHALHLLAPLSVQSSVVQNNGHNASAMNGRIAVNGASKDFQLRFDTSRLAWRISDYT